MRGWHPKSAPRRLLRWTRWLFLSVLLPLALLVGLGQWWLLPRLNDYRDVLAATLGDYLHRPVLIESVTAVRDDWQLALQLQRVSLQEPGRDAPLVTFSRAVITLDLWRSLRDWRPILDHVRLEGVSLSLESDAAGTFRLSGSGDSAHSVNPVTNTLTLPDVTRWLFSLPELEIVGERFALRQPSGSTVQLFHPHLQLEDNPNGQRLAVTAYLSESREKDRLALVVEHPRDGQQSATGQGRFALRADQLSAAAFPLPLPLPFRHGQLGLELNGEWQQWKPSRLEGRLWLRQAALKAEARTAPLRAWLTQWPDSDATFAGQWQPTGWQLQGQLQFSDGKKRRAEPLDFELNRSEAGWQGQLRGLRTQDAAVWATPWLDESGQHTLIALDPRGALPKITFQAGPSLTDYRITAQFRDITYQPFRGLPGVGPLAGTVEWGPQRGRLRLNSRKVHVDTAGTLRGPLTLATVKGTVNWTHSPASLVLDTSEFLVANPDLDAEFRGTVTLPAKGDPVLDLTAHYSITDIARVQRYLPAALMPAKAVAWLDRALVSGRVVDGELRFRGPPTRFPFDAGEGEFKTAFRIENATVDYVTGWPKLERGQINVTFHNRRLQVDTQAGYLRDSTVERLSVWIDDLGDAVVQVKGRAKGPGAGMWQAFQNSPASHVLGETVPDWRIEGTSTLDLELAIPLDSRPHQIRGRVGLLGNTLRLLAWKLELTRLQGELHFSDADLNAHQIRGMLHGEPIRLDVSLAGQPGERALQTRLRGRLDWANLLGTPAAALKPYLVDKAAWDATLTVPTQHLGQEKAPPFALNLHSDLRGVAVRLPAPLGKTAREARPVTMTLQPSGPPATQGTTLAVALNYGSAVRAALELGDFPHQPRLQRGELRIGAGAATLPDAPGLAVIVHLPRWDLAMLGSAIAPTATREPASTRQSARNRDMDSDTHKPPLWQVLRTVDARIDELIMGGYAFPKVALHAAHDNDQVQIKVKGETLAGRVTVPDAPTPQRPVTIALQRLALADSVEAEPESAVQAIDPRHLPPLVFTVAELWLKDTPLGRFRATVQPVADGVRLTDINLHTERQQLDASGEWRWMAGSQRAQFQATLHSQSLGETLAAFGETRSAIDRGETQAELAVQWAGPLSAFALERVEGTLKFQVGSGQLRDINPGVGRMLGMLSIQNITRRLSFDFSDLFQKGMGFDRISGDFTFGHGQARTDNLVIEAPSARIEIGGRVGLQARDLDQTITVVPNFGGTLPVAGTLAGGPAVGAAVFVAERLLQKGIEHATRYRYRLRGSWDKPTVDSLQEPLSMMPPQESASNN